jgi:hypothetical protein
MGGRGSHPVESGEVAGGGVGEVGAQLQELRQQLEQQQQMMREQQDLMMRLLAMVEGKEGQKSG